MANDQPSDVDAREPADPDAYRLSESVTLLLFGYDVFISYPRRDGEAVALALYRALRRRGYVPFLDRHAGLYGTDLQRTLRRALRRSQAMVVIASPASFDSPHVEFEFSSFAELHRGKPRPCIPVGTQAMRLGCPWPAMGDLVWIEHDAAAPVDLDHMFGKVEQRLTATRREVLLRNALGAAASVFLAVAAYAWWERDEAVRQRDRALALRLASRSELLREEQASALETAALLAVESALRGPDEKMDTGRAVAHVLDVLPSPVGDIALAAPARALRFTDDGQGLAVLLADGGLQVFDRAGSVRWKAGGAGDAVAILAATQETVQTVDAHGVASLWRRDGPPARSGSPLPPGALLSADGRHALVPAIAPGSQGRMVDLASGTAAPVAGLPDLHDITVWLVSPDPEGRFVLAAFERSRRVALIDRLQGTRVDLEPGNVVDVAAFSPDAKRVALGGRNFEVTVYRTSGGAAPTARVRHQGYVRALAFSGDGRFVLTRSTDHTCRVIVSDGGAEALRAQIADGSDAIAFDPRGDLVALAGASRVRLLKALGKGRSRKLPADLREISLIASMRSPVPGKPGVKMLLLLAAIGGDRVAVAHSRSRQVSLFDIAGGERLGSWPLSVQPRALAVDATGATIAVMGDDQGVWTNAGQIMQRVGDASMLGNVTTLAVAGDWIVAGGEAGALALPRNAARAPCRVPGSAYVRAVAVSDRSATAIVGGERGVEVVDLAGCRTTVRVPLPEAPLAVAISPDDRLMAVGTADDPVTLVYRLQGAAASPLYAIPRQGAVRALAFDAQGARLVVGAEDRTTRVYDLSDGQETSRMAFTISPWSVGFSSAGSVRSLTGEDSDAGTDLAVFERLLDLPSMIAEVCRRLEGRRLNTAEWNRYLPGVPSVDTCAPGRR